MTVRVDIGGSNFELVYTQDDVLRAEQDFGVGYLYFFDRRVLSLQLIRILFRRGLRQLDDQGTRIYAVSQSNDTGLNEAGQIVNRYLTDSNKTLWDALGAVYEAFVDSGWLQKIELPAQESTPIPPGGEENPARLGGDRKRAAQTQTSRRNHRT